MSDWTAGYVADIGYTYGYYAELNPLRIRLALLNAGFAVPRVLNACELGFGQGVSVNMHAAASDVAWHGTDFNPAQAGFARELATASGVNARLTDDAFSEYAKRDDLPNFDYIGLHGIWSWISDENRHVIVDFIRRKLNVGGVLYISYNTLPGWSGFAPVRHLMTRHAEIIGSEGTGIVNRINGAIEFTEKLLKTNPVYARTNPQIADRVAALKNQNRQYLAHEYFNRDWHPMHFATMADWLEPAKVQYACSSNYLDHVDAVNLTNDQQTFLREIPDDTFRQSVRDFMVNQQFRRDYWVKGARRLHPLAQLEEIRSISVLLVIPREEVSLKIQGSLGEAALTPTVYNPILDVLKDHQPKRLGSIEGLLAAQGVTLSQLIQAVIILAGEQKIAVVQDEQVTLAAKEHCDALNLYLMKRAKHSGEIAYLASPVTGGGLLVSRFQQLFLLALADGLKQPAEWVAFAWSLLKQQGQKIVKEGTKLETDEQNMQELTTQANDFQQKNLPIMKALKIA
jgi:SAM-dependent methyltransferase